MTTAARFPQLQQATVYIPGVWDLLHAGHIVILARARALGDKLIVGVPSDQVVSEDKRQAPIIPLDQRVALLSALRCVDQAVPYYRLEFVSHLEIFQPNILVVGQTWGSQQRHKDAERWIIDHGGRLVKLPYTAGISTSLIKERIIAQHHRNG